MTGLEYPHAHPSPLPLRSYSYYFGLVVVVVGWILNVVGVDAVGLSAMILTLLILIPYIVFVALALPEIKPSRWSVVPDPDSPDLGVNWAVFLSVLLWATAGFDDAGAFAGSVKDPRKSYVNGLIICIIIVTLVYLLPVAAGVCVLPYDQWNVGAFKDAAQTIGSWLAIWISFAAFAGCLGSFNSLLCADAIALKCMASLRWVPSIFGSVTLPLVRVEDKR